MSTPNVNAKYEASRVRKYELGLSRYYRMPAVQSSLTVVLSLFVAAFFLLFALRPTFITIVKLQKDITESKQTFATLETKVNSLQRASKTLEQLAPVLPMIESSIPSNEAGYASAVSTLEIVAKQSGVTLNTSSMGESVLYSRLFAPFTLSKNLSVVTLPFTLRVVGDYTGLSIFLKNLLSVDRIIKIESISFAREGNTKGSTTTTTSLTMTGEAYYMADQTQLSKALPVPKKGAK